jgi:hypothetical protein
VDEELNPPARKPSVELCSPSRSPWRGDDATGADSRGSDDSSSDGRGSEGSNSEGRGSEGRGSDGRGTGSGVYSFATPDSGKEPVKLDGCGTAGNESAEYESAEYESAECGSA